MSWDDPMFKAGAQATAHEIMKLVKERNINPEFFVAVLGICYGRTFASALRVDTRVAVLIKVAHDRAYSESGT